MADLALPLNVHAFWAERWSGEPICVIETSAVAIVPFDEVAPEFAAAEGEDDGSLESSSADPTLRLDGSIAPWRRIRPATRIEPEAQDSDSPEQGS